MPVEPSYTSAVLEILLSTYRIMIFIMQNQLHIQHEKFVTFLQHYMLSLKSSLPKKTLLLNGFTRLCPFLFYHYKQKRKKKYVKLYQYSAYRDCKLLINQRIAYYFLIVQQPQAVWYLFTLLLIHQENYHRWETKFCVGTALSSLFCNYQRGKMAEQSFMFLWALNPQVHCALATLYSELRKQL